MRAERAKEKIQHIFFAKMWETLVAVGICSVGHSSFMAFLPVVQQRTTHKKHVIGGSCNLPT